MERARDLADKTWKEAASYSEILAALEAKRYEANTKKSAIRDLEEHLEQVNESDEWLKSTLEQFDERVSQYREQEKSYNQQALKMREQTESLRRQQASKQTERGQYEGEKAQYERQLLVRKDITRKIAVKHQMRGFNDVSNDGHFDEFMGRLQKISKDSVSTLQRVKEENDGNKSDALTQLNQLTQRSSALQDVKAAAKKQIAENDSEAQIFQAKMDQIRVDEGSRAVTESNLKDTIESLNIAKRSIEAASWDKSLSVANSRLHQLDEENKTLNDELIQSTKRASELAQLAHLKKELKDREHSIHILSDTHGDRISSLIQEDWQPSTIEGLYQETLSHRIEDLKSSEKDRETVSRELEQLDFSLRKLQADSKSKMSELKNAKDQIYDATGGEPSEYSQKLDAAHANLENVKSRLKSYAGLEDYFNKCMEYVDEKHACRLCGRVFKDKEEKHRDRLRDLIQKARDSDKSNQIDEAENTLSQVKDASLHYEAWKRLLNDDIPTLEGQVSELEEQKNMLLRKYEEWDNIVSDRKEKKQDLETLSRTVSTIAKHMEDVESYQVQIDKVSTQQASQGLSRTLEDIQADISGVGENIRRSKQSVAQLTAERDQSRTNVNNLEIELSHVKNELSTANFELERKAGHAARVDDLKSRNQKQRQQIEKADADVKSLAQEVEKAQAKYDDICDRAHARERELDREVSQISESIQSLRLANNEIRSYIERGGPHQLPRCQQELQSLDSEAVRLEKEQSNIARTIKKVEQQLGDSEATRRQYSDNLRCRQNVQALKSLEAEIEKLSTQNAEVDRDRFQAESKRLSNEYHILSAQREGKMGEMKSKDVQLRELIADWETDYKGAAHRYKEMHIKVETTKAAVEDLGRYGGALDKAIMKYHSLKMEEINQIIEELWQRTYQGTDVDTILIRSDHESAKGNRSYNYRVCMVKNMAEMDMRGRCSAGQKVLASIIIRLALAECFGTNCGMIALDEPTTNLDRDNIQALAISLHDIIKARESQANFQMIVITHDEEFLRHMQCGDLCDDYYRVSRNQHEKSIIQRQSLMDVL